jgi:diguanylate cyclase (GGDEF)-like protein/PAS domain S-box-containing protein
MKRKIILSLLSLFLFSAAGAITATFYIRNTTETLARLIKLHQIEDFRQDLIISIQTVQSELYTIGTVFAHDPNVITDNVLRLERGASACSACHVNHSSDVITRIGLIQTDIVSYEEAVSKYLTSSANRTRINRLKLDAAEIGNRLLVRTEKMSVEAAAKLASTTTLAMSRIARAETILHVTMALTFLVGVLIAGNLTRFITRPIDALVGATRALAGGNLGHRIDYRDETEFGELAGHFNSMSAALKDGYAKLEQEISERKETAAALAKSEAFLNTIFDSIRDPFCIIDRAYRIVRANEAYAEMKHARLSGLIGFVCYESLCSRDAVCAECIVQATFLSGDSAAKEKSADGEGDVKIWYEIYTYPILDSAGTITHVVEYTRDITERKRAESALRESEERYALAARGANDGLWDWDLKNNRIHYSYRWKSMLGYGEKEVSNHPEEWLSRVHPDDRADVEAKIAAHLDGRNPHFESEYRILHKDGGFRWVLSRGLAVRNARGQASRMAGSQTDITLRKIAEEQLLYDAFHDALTGLPNRALFMDRLQHVIASSKRHPGQLYAVLFLDMDRFKIVNDSLGHTVGDQLLVAVARKLSECLRPGDTVARLGGDEFAVLLDGISELKDAVDIAERIHQKISVPLLVRGNEIFASLSIGVALSDQGYERPEQILRDADVAMYQAKSRGNSNVEIFDSKMHANILDRLQLEADLPRAIEHHEFLIHYQPIMDLQTQHLTGFEALIRWDHPKRGLVYPLEFIPLAEANGLINAIGEWSIRESCRQLSQWHRQYDRKPPLKMSINISSKQFLQPDLVEKLASILEETGIKADSLALEITESMIMDNIDASAETMIRLRDMGFHIHIDDFGTGYSSLSYLHRFPVTALKIDRSFISKLTASGENKQIITSIVSLAKSLNLSVIAEGLELHHQLSHVKDLQCRYGQGYIFSEPMESDLIDRWIRTENIPV